MGTIRLTEKQLAKRLVRDAELLPKGIEKVMVYGAQLGRPILAEESPVDTGNLKKRWKISKLGNGVVLLYDDAPYAGIVERGSRPFKATGVAVWFLKAWVMRKLMSGQMTSNLVQKGKRLTRRKKTLLEEQAESIAWAIAKSIEKRGLKGKFFVYKKLPLLRDLLGTRMRGQIREILERQP